MSDNREPSDGNPNWTRVGSADEDPADVIARLTPPPPTAEEDLASMIEHHIMAWGRAPTPQEFDVLRRGVLRKHGLLPQ